MKPKAAASTFGNMGLKVLAPVLIGLAVVAWLVSRDIDAEVLHSIHFTPRVWWFLALAVLFGIGRDAGMVWRFKIMTDGDLRLSACLRVTMLCEFTSAITPSTVGGSVLGMLFLNREGVPWGRATTLMMSTIFLDELFFVLFAPVAVAAASATDLFSRGAGTMGMGLRAVFWSVYGLIALWTTLLYAGILWRPQAVCHAINRLFALRWLRRRRKSAADLADNMVTAGRDLAGRPMWWWTKAFAATSASWLSRFLVVNMLFAAFASSAPQLLVFCRQIVVWLVLTVSPTPGGSGVSEWLFTEYYGDLIGSAGLALIIALFWRLISYYAYLAIGAIVVPPWLKTFKRNSNTSSYTK